MSPTVYGMAVPRPYHWWPYWVWYGSPGKGLPVAIPYPVWSEGCHTTGGPGSNPLNLKGILPGPKLLILKGLSNPLI